MEMPTCQWCEKHRWQVFFDSKTENKNQIAKE